ncbi:hypothetical protein [Emcibacter nanhaiensis]|uniref:Uncharacterized protein n=1 Tax=Emcibacter nanhaiensis TaxID=1505037 RepID=A0A501PFP6_9PROT|nr:hypothetical protein [Emcibacter nanhaiensis]TPD58968.1 hypothetical protein FIV46_12075 [Emcibacter nanhaiensis]
MLCRHNGEQRAPRTTLDEGVVAASTLWIMSRKELPIRFKAYPHANDNGSVSGSPPDPRLLCLARLIARAAVRDLIDGQTANDNVTVAGPSPATDPTPQSTSAPSLSNLPAGTQLYLFPDLNTARDNDDH